MVMMLLCLHIACDKCDHWAETCEAWGVYHCKPLKWVAKEDDNGSKITISKEAE